MPTRIISALSCDMHDLEQSAGLFPNGVIFFAPGLVDSTQNHCYPIDFFERIEGEISHLCTRSTVRQDLLSIHECENVLMNLHRWLQILF